MEGVRGILRDDQGDDQDRKPPAKVIHFSKQQHQHLPPESFPRREFLASTAQHPKPGEARTPQPRLVAATPEMMTPHTSQKHIPGSKIESTNIVGDDDDDNDE
jgi:hypothetical protein